MFASTPCGLEKLSEAATWPAFLQKQKELPVCKTGHEPGECLENRLNRLEEKS